MIESNINGPLNIKSNREGIFKIEGINSQSLKESLIKDLSQLNFNFVKNSPDIIKEISENEIVLNPELTEEIIEKVLKFIKESDKYKDLIIKSKLVDKEQPKDESKITTSN